MKSENSKHKFTFSRNFAATTPSVRLASASTGVTERIARENRSLGSLQPQSLPNFALRILAFRTEEKRETSRNSAHSTSNVTTSWFQHYKRTTTGEKKKLEVSSFGTTCIDQVE
jgi:hypothetical protein